MKVSPLEHEAGRFHVASETNPDETYIVDLTEFAHGACTCDDFLYRDLANAEAELSYSDCKHITAARAHATLDRK